jgi:uncharacterized protein with GYD domain
MKIHSVIVASALALGFALPAMAQSSTMHRYAQFFKYSDSAVKAMTENPQDRSAAVAKLFEGFGGKVEASYWFPGNLEWDGMLIVQIPGEVTDQAIALTTRATGNFTRNASVSLMSAEEFKAAMDKAKSVKSGYTAPTATKQ